MPDKEYTERGFRVFLDLGNIYVVESSIAFRGAHVRIYDRAGHSSDCVHLNVEQARSVQWALNEFIMEAEEGLLTELP